MHNNILQSMVFGMMNSFLGVFNKVYIIYKDDYRTITSNL